MQSELEQFHEIQDVNSDLEFRSPQIRVKIDRERAALYGLSPSDISNALYGAYGPSNVSMIYSPKTQYRVITEIQKKYQAYSDYLSKINFKTSTGTLIPLD